MRRNRSRQASGLRRKPQRPRLRPKAAFLNVPYDLKYEPLFLAFIAGLCGFGLIPRATIEITGSARRLDRILALIRECRYSFHDLSRVELDRDHLSTPRFNMPFELGVAIMHARTPRVRHELFVFEAVHHRLKKSLSDMDGTDPYIHGGKPLGVLRGLANALSRTTDRPKLSELEEIFSDLKRAARDIKSRLHGGSLFEAGPFKDLVFFAVMSAKKRIASLTAK